MIIEGRVEGDVFATESVSIRQTAKVIGNIFAPRVGIADGAHFSGRIDMNHKGVAAKQDKPLSDPLSDPQAERLLASGGLKLRAVSVLRRYSRTARAGIPARRPRPC